MVKVKNKKRISADGIHSKKGKWNVKKSMNPFEVHVNKEKLRVLGKSQKNDRGLPGISRAKAIQKRKGTLLQEYKIQNKSNKFMDKRIGERNQKMTDEEKVMARFTMVRVKANNKKSIFNLADDEILTHKGQTLSEIEKFDDPRSDDEESLIEGNSGTLDRDFVSEAHFGGGMLKKVGSDGAKSHKDLIDQLIAESKKRKAEKQKTKEATLELTEKLDTEWKDLLPLVSQSKKSSETEIYNSKVDSYDKVMRELKFEARGTVSDRLKTEEEIAKEDRENLEELEKQRMDRMKGLIDEKTFKMNHRSADDLEDDFIYEEIDEHTLSYSKEGTSNVKVDADMNGRSIKVQNEDSEDSVERENSEDGGSSDEETESEDDLSDIKQKDSESEEEISNENGKEILKADQPVEQTDAPVSSSECEKEINEKATPELTKKDSTIIETNNDLPSGKKYPNLEKELVNEHMHETIKNDLLKRKKIMEQAREELPYTFSLPESYESLQKVLYNQSSINQGIIIERMIKCNHPSLAERNKDSLGLLFAYLLQYLNDLFAEPYQDDSVSNCFEIFKALVPQIYELAQLNPQNAHNSVLEVIKEKHADYKKKSKEYPGLEVLAFLKLVSILFPTSDFRHQVVTPCLVFMEQMLIKCKVNNKRNMSYGLFISTLVLEYTTLSKRYLPAVLNYLLGLLHMAIPKAGVKLLKIVPPFKATSSVLVLLENYNSKTFSSFQLLSTDLLHTELTEEYKVRVLFQTIKMLAELHTNLQELSSRVEIFDPILKYVELIPTNYYPNEVKNGIEHFIKTLKDAKVERKLTYLIMEAKKPKALRLYEPKIVEVYDRKSYKVQSKEKAERSKLLHKLKKEQKGALREIRRDNAFLGRVKIHQQIQSDKDRREKVKRIYAEAAMQQSELNDLDRKKKRKK